MYSVHNIHTLFDTHVKGGKRNKNMLNKLDLTPLFATGSVHNIHTFNDTHVKGVEREQNHIQ